MAKEEASLPDDYKECAVCEMNPRTIWPRAQRKITSRRHSVGKFMLRSRSPLRQIFMPGPSTNVVWTRDLLHRLTLYKGCRSRSSPSDEEVLSAEELTASQAKLQKG